MLKNFETIGLFPVPVIKIKFKDHYKYNFPEVEKKDKKPDSWVESLHTTFPYIPDDDLIVPPMVRDSLMRDLKDVVVEVSQELNIPTNIYLLQLWYNIYHDNQGQERHNHLCGVGNSPSLWSGVYYNKNASPTQFFRSDSSYQTQIFDEYKQSALAPCLSPCVAPSVEDGDILLFPPYLDHCVLSEPYHRDNMRMTFSFNINLTT